MRILLDTLVQILVMLRHLVAEISHFKFDDYRVIHTGASDLNIFVGGLYDPAGNQYMLNTQHCQRKYEILASKKINRTLH